ncbi:MAG: hypothetical protein M1826_001256 [Phylliscum demangeonii]|nr:MAG: hypothetical protein M1826_001256 [Phylliscum demangeonii]
MSVAPSIARLWTTTSDWLFSFPTIKKLLYLGPHSAFNRPSVLEELRVSPLDFLARRLYALILVLRGPAHVAPPHQPAVRVVCISDTHGHTAPLPDGDLLIHAGDLANDGTADEIQAQLDWLRSLPHGEKVVVGGNHDGFLDPRSRRTADAGHALDWGRIHYLERSSVRLRFPHRGDRALDVYGAPHIPECGPASFAFQYPRALDVWQHAIPMGTDVLVTHTPPRYHGDLPVAALGCDFLRRRVWKVRPALHVFGHVHAGYGRESAFWDESQERYERFLARPNRAGGWRSDLMDGRAWTAVVRLLASGAKGVLSSWLGGRRVRGSLLVNAALSVDDTGRLGNPPQVVYI